MTEMIHFELCWCADCGVPFMIPSMMMRMRIEEQAGVFCPSGHESFLDKDAPPPPKETDGERKLRQELIQALHRAEQAEAQCGDQRRAKRKGEAA